MLRRSFAPRALLLAGALGAVALLIALPWVLTNPADAQDTTPEILMDTLLGKGDRK